jgi:putative thioredoxin
LFIQYVLQQEYEQALSILVEMMEQDAKYAENFPQKAMLKIFNILGAGHPLIGQYRPNLKRYIH